MGLVFGIVLLVLQWRIKKYPFKFREIRTYIVIFVCFLTGAIVVDTFTTFYSITFKPKSMGLCYDNCNEYWMYIFAGSLLLLFIELGTLVLHYSNINFKKFVENLCGEVN